MKVTKFLILILLLSCAHIMSANDNDGNDTSTKKERNFIREGNSLYQEERYAEAEVAYRKALEQNAHSEIAAYNLASSLIKQSGASDPNNDKNPMTEATELLKNLTSSAQNQNVVENSYYNLGNIAFNQQQYQQSIDMYKNVLRRNPDNDKVRENLRIAQLKLKEQQQNQQNKNQNNKQDNKQNDKQKQNKEQDQNNDQQQKQEDNKQDNNKDDKRNNESPKQDNDKEQQKQQQLSQGISDANAEKILKTMENEENATRRKVNEKKNIEDAKAAGRPKMNQW